MTTVRSHTPVAQVMSTIDRDNAASVHIARKVGGMREREITHDGREVVVYSFNASSEHLLYR